MTTTYGLSANFYIGYLATALNSGGTETEIDVSTLETLTGEVLNTADFANLGRGVVTVDPLSSDNIEAASFTGIDPVNVAFTGVTRNLSSVSGDAAGRTAPFHPVGTPVIISFGVHNFQDLVAYLNVSIAQFKSYVDNAVAGGVGTASTTNSGTVLLSASPNVTLGNPTITIASPAVVTFNSHGLVANDAVQFTTTGTLPTGILANTTYYVIPTGLTTNSFEISTARNGAAVNTSGSQTGTHSLIKVSAKAVSVTDPQYVEYFTETGGANTYVITPNPPVAAYAAGQQYSFKAANANTGASTLNVNSLGAKTIVKNGNVALLTGDIILGQVIQVQYDGTNFQVQGSSANPTGNGSALTNLHGVYNYQTFTASGTWTKPSGLAGTEMVYVQLWGAGGGGGGSVANGFNGGGGGGGSYIEAFFPVSALSATVTVTIPTGGTGGAAGANPGVAGGNTTFGSILTAYGGGGGGPTTGGNAFGGGGGGGGQLGAGATPVASGGGTGGAPIGGGAGAVSLMGGGGGATTGAGGSSSYGGGGGGGGNVSAGGGTGGASLYGGGGGASGSSSGGGVASIFGGNGGVSFTNANGGTGVAPGGGGGAGTTNDSTNAHAGGAGARGEVRVWVNY